MTLEPVTTGSDGEGIGLLRDNPQLRLLTDALPAPIAYVDGEGRYRFVNRAYEEWWRKPREEIVGKLVRELKGEEAYKIFQPHVEGALAGKAQRFPTRIKYPDGQTRDVDVTYSPDLGAAGEVKGFAILVMDISERKRSQEELRVSEERFRTMANSAPVLVLLSDPEKRCTWFNQPWLDFVGRRMEQEVGEGWMANVHPEDLAECTKTALPRFEAKERFTAEFRMRRHDGEWRWVLAHGVPLFGAAKEFTGYIVSCVDITERKFAEDKVHAAKEAAEAASRSKDEFLAILSHEMRTPLAPVLPLVSAMEQDPRLAEAREDLAMIRRNVELEARLIDDLLDLTRVARGKLELRREAVSVHRIIADAVRVCDTEMVQAKGLEIRMELGAERTTVWADGTRVEQIVWNLLNNACKFTPAGGRITIRTDNPDSATVALEVADTGCGIDAELLPRMFNAFEQGADPEARRKGGLGLGLAISRALVALHGGTIEAESEGTGKGARFRVKLPVSQEPVAKGARGRAEGGEGRRRGRILLVEDHSDTARVMKRLLEKAGHAVKMSPTFAGAVDLAARERFDVVVSDVGLPDGSGHDLMGRLRGIGLMKGIALSGYGMDADVRKSKDAGFAEHLVKPVDFERLMMVLEELLRE